MIYFQQKDNWIIGIAQKCRRKFCGIEEKITNKFTVKVRETGFIIATPIWEHSR